MASKTFESVLSEARKQRLCLVLAYQYLRQLDEEVIDDPISVNEIFHSLTAGLLAES